MAERKPKVPPGTSKGVNPVAPQSVIVEIDFPMEPIVDAGELRRRYGRWREGDAIGPALAQYDAVKTRTTCGSEIEAIAESYRSAVSRSRLLLVVGCAYLPHDTHVWDPLLDSRAPLVVVAPYPSPDPVP